MTIEFINEGDSLHFGKTLGTPFIGFISQYSKKKKIKGLAFHGKKHLKDSAIFLFYHLKISEGLKPVDAVLEAEKVFGKFMANKTPSEIERGKE